MQSMQTSKDIETFVQGASKCIPESPFLLLDGNLAFEIGECVKKRGYDASRTYTHNGVTYIKVKIKNTDRLVGTFVTNGNNMVSFEPHPEIS
jgi:hypothetical protein